MSADSSVGTLFEPRPDGPAAHLAGGLVEQHPMVTPVAVVVAGWATVSLALIGIGLLLTNVVLGSPVVDGQLGLWDADVNQWLADGRSSVFDTASEWGSRLSDTITIVVATGVLAVVFLALRWWQEALFIVLAPTVEVTVFLAVTFVVDRERPAVERLDAAPPTSSFPSGHVAAAIAFYVALALIIDNRVRSAVVQAVVWLVAIFAPMAVLASRLYRGMHYPTDVVFGVLGGLACLAVALLAVRTATAVAHGQHATTAAYS